MPTQTTLKQFIKNNVFYQNFIRPIRVKWKEKALAKLDDQSYFTKRHKTIFGYTPDFRNPIYTSLADKLKARIYIASILEKYNATQSLDNVNMRWGGGSFIAKKTKAKHL